MAVPYVHDNFYIPEELVGTPDYHRWQLGAKIEVPQKDIDAHLRYGELQVLINCMSDYEKKERTVFWSTRVTAFRKFITNEAIKKGQGSKYTPPAATDKFGVLKPSEKYSQGLQAFSKLIDDIDDTADKGKDRFMANMKSESDFRAEHTRTTIEEIQATCDQEPAWLKWPHVNALIRKWMTDQPTITVNEKTLIAFVMDEKVRKHDGSCFSPMGVIRTAMTHLSIQDPVIDGAIAFLSNDLKTMKLIVKVKDVNRFLDHSGYFSLRPEDYGKPVFFATEEGVVSWSSVCGHRSIKESLQIFFKEQAPGVPLPMMLDAIKVTHKIGVSAKVTLPFSLVGKASSENPFSMVSARIMEKTGIMVTTEYDSSLAVEDLLGLERLQSALSIRSLLTKEFPAVVVKKTILSLRYEGVVVCENEREKGKYRVVISLQLDFGNNSHPFRLSTFVARLRNEDYDVRIYVKQDKFLKEVEANQTASRRVLKL